MEPIHHTKQAAKHLYLFMHYFTSPPPKACGIYETFSRIISCRRTSSHLLCPQANFSYLISVTVHTKIIFHTLCKQLEVSDFFSHLQLKDLLQNVLSQALLGNAHSFKLFVSKSQQSTAWMQKPKRIITQGFPLVQQAHPDTIICYRKNSQP